MEKRKQKFLNLLLNHSGNYVGKTGQKTELISEYKGRTYSHVFKCGLCGNEFIRVIDDMIRYGRNCCCYRCSLNLKREIFQLSFDEAQDRINERFNDSIEISDDVFINMRTNMSFFCCICRKNFTKRLDDLLQSRGCPHCLPYGYSYKAIQWINTLENKNIQHAENSGEYRIRNSKYWADGFDLTNNTIFEFHGCDFHGHLMENADCPKCKGRTTPFGISFKDVHDKLLEKRKHIHNEQYNYVEIWECEYDASRKK